MSEFLIARRQYAPQSPVSLTALEASSVSEPAIGLDATDPAIAALFPQMARHPLLKISQNDAAASGLEPLTQKTSLRVGAVFSGGQAPGGHNVVAGLYEGIRKLHPDSTLTGFAGGPAGILKNKAIPVTPELIATFRNTGGFDLFGTGRTKLETPEDFATCARIFTQHDLDALVVIGGDDSNTNAAFLAEYLLETGHKTRIVGVPKTIDSDLRGPFTETSFGFDTAVRVYAELIANIAKDSQSGKKYYHFIRLMGRSASHITMEAALQTRPNVALISEEIARDGMTMSGIIDLLADVVIRRGNAGKNFGVVLVPEGLIEFVPEMRALIANLNEVISGHQDYMDSLRGFTAQIEYLAGRLSKESAATLATLPLDIQRQMIMDRDPHGNVALSQVETEKLLTELLTSRLGELKSEGHFHGKFSCQTHFLGYEGRCAAPTNFDANYAWSLGLTAAGLAASGHSGYLAAVHGLTMTPDRWQAWGVPLVSMLTIERRHGKDKAVIRKTLVDLEGPAFQLFMNSREAWAWDEHYQFAGPIQYFGPAGLVDRIPVSLSVQ